MTDGTQPPGWYPAEGDPPGTVRWWDGSSWVGGPQQQGMQQQAGYVAPSAGGLASGQQLADPWLRIAAAVIDGIIGIIISIPFGIGAAFSAFSGDGADVEINIGLAIVGAIVTAAYWTLMNSYLSGTVGKLVLGLRIVQRDGTEPLGLPVGIRRSANKILGIVGQIPILNIIIGLGLLVLNIVSLVFLFSDEEHRTVMDRIGDTYVIKK